MTRLDTPWYVEVQSPDGTHAFVLVEEEGNPSYCTLKAIDHRDQQDPDVVRARVIGTIFAPPVDALRLLRAVGFVVLNDDSKALTDWSAEDREDYFALLGADG